MSSETNRLQIFQQLETMLQEQPGLSEADRAAVIREVRDALERQPAEAPALDVASLRETWMNLAQELGDDLDASEREALVRRIEQALEPLQGRAVQDALEYERRRQDEGDDKAAAWLADRNQQRRSERAPGVGGLHPLGAR